MKETNLILVLFAVIGFILSSGNSTLAETANFEPIQPLPQRVDLDRGKVELGRKLFHDASLSRNNTVACASCHNLNTGGVDRQYRSIGIGGAIGDLNTPTVLNSAFNFRQLWDGRASSLEDQIDGPIQNPKEMGSTWAEVVSRLKNKPEYIKAFQDVYKSDIDPTKIKDAIAIFERSLVTPDARFDQYLKGDSKAISAAEVNGYQKFKSYGCIACHQGMNVGGNMFQTMGIMGDYFKDRGTAISNSDLGKFNTTGREADKHVFKVPSLRNVELTSPYFHDGSAKTLEQAVRVMAKYQLGRKIPQEDVDLIVQFLKTLTGKQPITTPKAMSEVKNGQ